jgi:hypothetical protein
MSREPPRGLVQVKFSNQLEADPTIAHKTQAPRRRNAVVDCIARTGNPIAHISKRSASDIDRTIPASVGASDPHRSNPRVQNVVAQGLQHQPVMVQKVRRPLAICGHIELTVFAGQYWRRHCPWIQQQTSHESQTNSFPQNKKIDYTTGIKSQVRVGTLIGIIQHLSETIR